MHQKGLAIDKELGRRVGIAAHYSNLGSLYKTQRKFEKAELMYQEGLAIDMDLKNKMGIATAYANLGILYIVRGELKQAKQMFQQSLVLFEQLGAKHKMAWVTKWLEELRKGRYGNKRI